MQDKARRYGWLRHDRELHVPAQASRVHLDHEAHLTYLCGTCSCNILGCSLLAPAATLRPLRQPFGVSIFQQSRLPLV